MYNDDYNDNSGCGCGWLCFIPIAMSFLLFLFRIVNLIQWEWYWILAPIWISFGAFAILVAVLFVISTIIEAIKNYRANHIRKL